MYQICVCWHVKGISVNMHATNRVKRDRERGGGGRNFKNGVVIDGSLLSLLHFLTDFVSVLDT